MIERVEAADDPRLGDYRDIREADRLRHEGVFLAEGEVVVRVMARRSRFRVRSLFLAESRLDALRDVIAMLDPSAPVYVAPQRVMDGIVGYPIHRGILASGDRGSDPPAAALLAGLGGAGRRVVVGLVGVSNHDNTGGIFRNCGAFGADAVLLDETSSEPLYRKAIRVSSGATLFVPFARVASASAMLEVLRSQGFTTLALTPDASAVDITALGGAVPLPERVALLLGAEGPGLAPEILAAADLRVKIGLASGFDSLNVATTSGIALHACRSAV